MRVNRSLPSFAAVVLTAAFATSGQAACYTVYRGNGIVYRSIQVPVDLSQPLHMTVPVGFGPGATMVIAEGADGCRTVDNRADDRTGARRRVPGSSAASRGRRQAEAEQWLEDRAAPIRSEVGVSDSDGTAGGTSVMSSGGTRADGTR